MYVLSYLDCHAIHIHSLYHQITKALGGGSAVNAMVWTRGERRIASMCALELADNMRHVIILSDLYDINWIELIHPRKRG